MGQLAKYDPRRYVRAGLRHSTLLAKHIEISKMESGAMDLIDRLQEMSVRLQTQLAHLSTEEATKNALIMPFIGALGYNVFDPTEVVPEFTADVGTKRGEKVDYAIMRDGVPIILVECKASSVDLDAAHASQLYRYFSVTPARFGVLTNGVCYKFFSDLEAPNRMDSRPFFEFDLRHIDKQSVAELKRFEKQSFDLDAILSTASELKYTKGIKRAFAQEWLNPSDELVRLFGGRVYSGRMTQGVREQFSPIVKRAFHEFVTDRLNERLKSALERSDTQSAESSSEVQDRTPAEGETPDSDVVTTEDEMEAFYIVRAILGDTVDVRRVFMRDTQSYCGILLDDNNRKPICRLHFNSPTRRHIGLLDEEKNETRHPIDDPVDLYKHAAELKVAARRYNS